MPGDYTAIQNLQCWAPPPPLSSCSEHQQHCPVTLGINIKHVSIGRPTAQTFVLLSFQSCNLGVLGEHALDCTELIAIWAQPAVREREGRGWRGGGGVILKMDRGGMPHLVQSCGVLAEALSQGGQEVVVACMGAHQMSRHSNDCHQRVVLEV